VSRMPKCKEKAQTSSEVVEAIAHSRMEVGGGHDRFYYEVSQDSEAA
jgi:hypothetical protein